MANKLFSPVQARIPIGSVGVNGQKYEVMVNVEWAKFFDGLTTTTNDNTTTVINGRNGVDGPAIAILGAGDGEAEVEFMPGPPGANGKQGDSGPALFLMNDEAPSNDTYMLQPAQTPEAFIAPTLLNSWLNLGGGFGSAGYYKDPFGIVHLRGTVTAGVAATIFNLPVGYRPLAGSIFVVIANNALGRVDIFNTGDVSLVVGSNAFVSLEGITFRAN